MTNQLFACSAGASDQRRTYLNQWKWRLANQMAAKMTCSTTNSATSILTDQSDFGPSAGRNQAANSAAPHRG